MNRISRDEVVGVPVPTYPQIKNKLSDTSLNWFYSANEKITIRGERLIEIEQSANTQFKNVERLRKRLRYVYHFFDNNKPTGTVISGL